MVVAHFYASERPRKCCNFGEFFSPYIAMKMKCIKQKPQETEQKLQDTWSAFVASVIIIMMLAFSNVDREAYLHIESCSLSLWSDFV